MLRMMLLISGCNGLEVLGTGHNWNDLTYLREAPLLVTYTLLGFGSHNLKSLQGIEFQKKLKSITLDIILKSKIDWMDFPDLEDVYTENCFVNESLWNCRSLQKLRIANCSEAGWENLSRLKRLRELEIVAGGMRNFEGLDADSLKSLAIHRNRSFSGLGTNSKLGTLEQLELSSCKKLNDLCEFGQLESLKVLKIHDCGTIGSLAPLLALKRLEEVYLFGTRVEDGKFLGLSELPTMKKLYFDDLRNCDITLREALEKLGVNKKEWPLSLANPRKWKRIVGGS